MSVCSDVYTIFEEEDVRVLLISVWYFVVRLNVLFYTFFCVIIVLVLRALCLYIQRSSSVNASLERVDAGE